MKYGKKDVRQVSRCLECGSRISYGRTDKKFCCEDCKNRHHNHRARASRHFKRRVVAILERNYDILDGLLREGIDAVWLSDVTLMGFNPGYATSYRKTRCHSRYGCFDISYIQTPNRLSSISKIQNLSLTLQASPDKEDQV